MTQNLTMTHEAGVTAILPLANDLLITGSYDDNIRLIAAPPVGRRQVAAELNLGGGVWRLRMLDDGSAANNDR
jgi:diphthamide biosynthesis protein 7